MPLRLLPLAASALLLAPPCEAFAPSPPPLARRTPPVSALFSYLDSLSSGQDARSHAPPAAQGGPVASGGGPSSALRRPVVAGNWKLNPATLPEASNLLQLLSANFLNNRADAAAEVVVFPPFPYLSEAVSVLQGTGIKVGAQNVGLQTKGAFTGEVAPSMVRSLGCDYVMLGHSERRTLFGETDAAINSKLKLCLDEPGLGVVLCVGETEEEYEANLLASVVDVQIRKGLSGVGAADLGRIVIAYEPVWAIGTGKVATPDQAQVAHVAVRDTLEDVYGSDAAQSVRVQYGGSVTPESIEGLMAKPDVDGALVGGASLTADSFTRIVDGAA
uniref:Triosephosphate isomerase n=1 Tax=Trieres chinensis TaxID=1514140 RepID=A0A7S2EGG0_TRICV|mmetsp:Transcript_22740/g.46120  ORF Transcript_22740/g.46120 Transcript_22740/m.46120 type:complete len:331 (+) Transcript_22740:41-1033(+)